MFLVRNLGAQRVEFFWGFPTYGHIWKYMRIFFSIYIWSVWCFWKEQTATWDRFFWVFRFFWFSFRIFFNQKHQRTNPNQKHQRKTPNQKHQRKLLTKNIREKILTKNIRIFSLMFLVRICSLMFLVRIFLWCFWLGI